MNIEKLDLNDVLDFKDMFNSYFIEIGHVVPKEILIVKLLDGLILEQYKNGIISIYVMKDENMYGFIIFQIDNDNSDWNKRPGWGFIREFYIIPTLRNKGLGSKMIKKVECLLKEKEVKNIYLTSNKNERTKQFYIKNGYIDEGIVDEISKLSYFFKQL